MYGMYVGREVCMYGMYVCDMSDSTHLPTYLQSYKEFMASNPSLDDYKVRPHPTYLPTYLRLSE